MKFIRVKKLNLEKAVLSKDSIGMFGTMLGIDKKALENLPDEEITIVNPDKIIGISQKMKTGIEGDDRLCCKLYFSPTDYWAVKWDDELKETIDSL